MTITLTWHLILMIVGRIFMILAIIADIKHEDAPKVFMYIVVVWLIYGGIVIW